MIKQLRQDFFLLIEYCKNKEKFDPLMFKIMSDNYSNLWKKLPQDRQGELAYLIHESYKIEL